MIGLLFVLFILLYVLFGFFLYGYIRGWGPGKGKSLLITLVILVGVPFGDVIPGKLYLAYVCHKDGGIKVNEVVNTPGYLVLDDYSYGCDRGCIRKLEEWRKLGKPMFIEAFVNYPKEYNFVDKPGYYRFELVERTPENCAFQKLLKTKHPTRLKNYKLANDYCVSSTLIDSPLSEFSVESWDYHNSVSNIMGIVADQAYIRQRSTGKVVAKATRYTHIGGWLRRAIANSIAVGHPDQCPKNMSYPLGSELMRLTFN